VQTECEFHVHLYADAVDRSAWLLRVYVRCFYNSSHLSTVDEDKFSFYHINSLFMYTGNSNE